MDTTKTGNAMPPWQLGVATKKRRTAARLRVQALELVEQAEALEADYERVTKAIGQ